MEERIIELELRFTEQQAFVQELSDVLIHQQRELNLLRETVQVLRKKLEAEPGMVDATANERPPHY